MSVWRAPGSNNTELQPWHIILKPEDAEALRAYWPDGKLSLTWISEELRHHPDTLRKIAKDLGLGERPPTTIWDEVSDGILKEGLTKGDSFSQIAMRIGRGCSRNAAIGRARRMGYEQMAAPTRPTTISRGVFPRTWSGKTPKAPKVEVPRHLNAGLNWRLATGGQGVLDAITTAHPPRPSKNTLTATVGLVGLTIHTCRFPIGDPGDEGFGFCGRESPAEKPYCATHARLAYQSPQPRKASAEAMPRALRRYA